MSAPVQRTGVPGITVRPFQVSDSREELYGFLEEIWPGTTRESLDRRWWWTAEAPPLWVAEEPGGRIAGTCGSIPFDLATRDEVRRGSWIVDYFVRRDYQGQGIGKRMVRAVAEQFDFLASLNQTDAAWAAFSRLGWTERRFVPLFLHPAARAALAVAGMRRDRDVEVTEGPPAFGPSFDTLWEERLPSLAPAAMRNRQALARRFDASERDYRVLMAHRGQRLVAYAIVRELPAGSIRSFSRFPIAMLSDYVADPSDDGVFTALAAAVLRWATARGLHFVLAMSAHARHQRVLRSLGFLSGSTPLLGRVLRKLDVGFTATPSAPPAPWHLTPADCDLDILFGATS